MEEKYIVDKISTFLHASASSLCAWLEKRLPCVSDTWWEDCVIGSLSPLQRENIQDMGYSKLSELSLAELLRITNKSWYDICTVAELPASLREHVRDMISVCNNWSYSVSTIPGKDMIISDLHIISSFIDVISEGTAENKGIAELIAEIEKPGSLKSVRRNAGNLENESRQSSVDSEEDEIKENSLIYLLSDPNVKGVVRSIKNLGSIKKYEVFISNDVGSQFFYSGQIALVRESTANNWVSADTVRSFLAAYQIKYPSSQNLYSLNSAKIDFVPYQFRPALKMIHADEPRILIADSVGVGKTIEAGLIIKELEARNDIQSIVVICPRPLVAEGKWKMEMERFDEGFTSLDGATFRQILSDTDRDGEWPSQYNKVIIPYSIMDSRSYEGEEQGKKRLFGLSELFPEPHFDLVIVDEAHHIRNGSMEKEKAFAYKCTKYFCDHADAVVMLTATPLQTGDKDLFTLLNVLRPDIIIDEQTFQVMSKPNEYISKAAHCIRTAEDNWAKKAINELLGVRKTQWGDNVISENPLYDSILQRLEKDDITREERVRLISDVESLHSFYTLINRTRRRDIQDFCIRRTFTYEVAFTEYQQNLHDELLEFEKNALSILHDPRGVSFMMSTIKRQAASCIFGLGPHIRGILERRIRQMNDDPDLEYDFINLDAAATDRLSQTAKRVLDLAENLPDEDPKFDELINIIEAKYKLENNKIMLFSTFRHTLAYLKRRLKNLGYRVEQIDGSVKDDVRFAYKERFQLSKNEPDAIDILLFTEVGSEGLDYQFCDTMINYDLPWNPMRIEQRIGRIDRRMQESEAVNIYNIITENTVDAVVYHRCLERIGVFERSIGECDAILGEIAAGIENIMMDSSLTDEERKMKLEQMADNEVRKMQELEKLEEEEKDLLGFDFSEIGTAQEIRHAENPWLTQRNLRRLVEQYLKERLGEGPYILGSSSINTLRLSAQARKLIREDLYRLSGKGKHAHTIWDAYLGGKKPTIPITFDSEAAAKARDNATIFVTPMHPLARQAADLLTKSSTMQLCLHLYSDKIPAGQYLFSVYAWRYTGFNSYTRIITVCENEEIESELPDILENSIEYPIRSSNTFDWTGLELRHVMKWQNAVADYQRRINTSKAFKLETLSNNYRNQMRSLERKINVAANDSIRRMYMSEMESISDRFEKKKLEIEQTRAEIYTNILVNGVVRVSEEIESHA